MSASAHDRPAWPWPALARPSRRDILAGGLLGAVGAASMLLRPTSAAPALSDHWIDAAVPQQLGPWQVAAHDGLVTAPTDELSAKLYDRILTRIYRADRAAGRSAPDAGHAPGIGAPLPDMALLIAYGRGQDADVQLHRPDACYPAQGFTLTDPRALPIRFAGRAVPAQVVTASRDDLVQQVFYWTRIAGTFPADGAAERRVIVHENLAGRMPDAVLVRISVDTAARAQAVAAVLGFIGLLGAALPQDGRRLLVDGFGGPGLGSSSHFAGDL
jgi:EpsI family protein